MYIQCLYLCVYMYMQILYFHFGQSLFGYADHCLQVVDSLEKMSMERGMVLGLSACNRAGPGRRASQQEALPEHSLPPRMEEAAMR